MLSISSFMRGLNSSSQYSVRLQTGRPMFYLRQKQRILPLACVSRSALSHTQPPIQWVSWSFSGGVKRGRHVTLTTLPHLVPRSKMSNSYTLVPPTSTIMSCGGTALVFTRLEVGLYLGRTPAIRFHPR